MSERRGLDRREFLKSLSRSVVVGGSLLGAAVLVKRPARQNDTCTSDGICTRCGDLSGCGLPQALSARKSGVGE